MQAQDQSQSKSGIIPQESKTHENIVLGQITDHCDNLKRFIHEITDQARAIQSVADRDSNSINVPNNETVKSIIN